jgi:hypothetical protein
MLLVINQYRGNTSVQQTQKIKTSEGMRVTHFRANNTPAAFKIYFEVNVCNALKYERENLLSTLSPQMSASV